MVKLPTPDPNEEGQLTPESPTQLVPETEAFSPTGDSPAREIPERIPFDYIDRQIALVLAAVCFALYLRNVAPDILGGDSGEFQFAAWRLGLAHPTGYPLYLLLGWLWQHALALVGASPAWSLNALSAFTAGVSVSLLYLAMARWTPLPSALRRMVGLYSSVLLAGNVTFWSQAVIAEVYALHVLLMLALLLATQSLVRAPSTPRLLLWAFLAGLSLTHHALTLLWLAALLAYWLLADDGWRRLPLTSWLLALIVGIAPLALYAYIPLRSGPQASPWYHQRLGDGMLTLYHNDWPSFWAYISGQSIGASFRSLDEALAQIPQAAWLWQYHFGWVGLAMVAAGVIWLALKGRRAILWPTLLYVIVQQIFNLFYNIGDILVYYIPLYLVASMWAGFGLAGLVSGDWRKEKSAKASDAGEFGPLSWVVAGALILLALRAFPVTSAQMDQSGATEARHSWQSILAAAPAPDAIMVSNDRNEVVPLFYLQAVEGRAEELTGLFPGISPDARFSDIGATLDTALAEGGDQPVYLTKSMPGLDLRYELQAGVPPLVQVLGVISSTPSIRVEQPYGPLQLLGYDLAVNDDQAEIALHWQVNEPMDANYIATAQLLTDADRKITQDDHAPGGDFYPTSLWKPGQVLIVRHTLPLAEALPQNVRLLAGFYHPEDQALLAQPLTIPLEIP